MSLRSRAWRPLARRAARRYVIGTDLEHAVAGAATLLDRGYAVTIGYWNESSVEPARVRDEYVRLVRRLDEEGVDTELAAKLPALGGSLANAGDIVRAASAAGLRLGFDSLGPESADSTFEAIEELRMFEPRLGCTIPARWRRSLHDADRALRGDLAVRLVKGQWRDPVAPDEGTEERFRAIVERVAGRAPRVSVATHDAALAEQALGLLVRTETPCELELLSALPHSRLFGIADELGVPVRVYLPYGSGSLPYRPADGRRRLEVLRWSLRDAALGARGRPADPGRWPSRSHSAVRPPSAPRRSSH
jgi:proline dehydrogenase